MSEVKNTEISSDLKQSTLTDNDSGFICTACYYNDLNKPKHKMDRITSLREIFVTDKFSLIRKSDQLTSHLIKTIKIG